MPSLNMDKNQVTANVKTTVVRVNVKVSGPQGIQGIPGDPASNIVTSVNARIGAVVGLAEQSDLVAHTSNTSNPHSVTKAQVGLGSVPNTDFTSAVTANTAKISFDSTSSTRLANTSGTNTGDQDLSSYATSSTVTAGLALKEDIANKSTTTTLGISDTLYPSQKAVKTYVDTSVTAIPLTNYVLKSGDTMTGGLTVTAGGITVSGNSSIGATSVNGNLTTRTLLAGTNLTYNLGGAFNYYSNTYTQRLNLNSTAYIDGAVAGTANLTGNLGILATSGSATHTLTLGSSATGITLYNTSDQTTNYERYRFFTNGTTYYLTSEVGGTGSNRALRIGPYAGNGSAYLQMNTTSTSGFAQINGDIATASSILLRLTGAHTASSGIQYMQSIQPTINQSGTAGRTLLLINETITAEGSGAKLLIDAQSGGVSKFKVANDGRVTTTAPVTLKGYTVATLPTGVQGDVTFVTDALAPTFGNALVGGGAVVAKAFYNGTAWINE